VWLRVEISSSEEGVITRRGAPAGACSNLLLHRLKSAGILLNIMAYRIAFGIPGAGKGLFSCQRGIEEIRSTDRCMITDFAWEKMPWVNGKGLPQVGLLAYLHNNYQETFGADVRIFKLSRNAFKHFYLYRAVSNDVVVPPDVGLPADLDDYADSREFEVKRPYTLYKATCVYRKAKKDEGEEGDKIVESFDTRLYALSGGHYILGDECWDYWPARGWSSTGRGIVQWVSLQRKFGDDGLLQTQATEDLDGILIRKAAGFFECVSRGDRRVGKFRQPDDFKVFEYARCPSPSDKPQNEFTFKLDINGLAQCYDTTATASTLSKLAGDIGKKKPGIPFFWLWCAAVVLPLVMGLCIWFGIHWARNASKRVAEKHTSKTVSPVQTDNTVSNLVFGFAAKAAQGWTGGGPSQVKPGELVVTRERPAPPPVYLVGMFMAGKRQVAMLSDGRRLDLTGDDAASVRPGVSVTVGTNVYQYDKNFYAVPETRSESFSEFHGNENRETSGVYDLLRNYTTERRVIK